MRALGEWLAFIERQHPKTIALGLERVAAVFGRMAVHLGCPVITVGGTNGKGSCCALLEWQTKEFLRIATAQDDWTVHVRPEMVVEIAFNDLQESSHYPGGLALRFARVKGYRPDKRPEDADTFETVRRIYQESVA